MLNLPVEILVKRLLIVVTLGIENKAVAGKVLALKSLGLVLF